MADNVRLCLLLLILGLVIFVILRGTRQQNRSHILLDRADAQQAKSIDISEKANQVNERALAVIARQEQLESRQEQIVRRQEQLMDRLEKLITDKYNVS